MDIALLLSSSSGLRKKFIVTLIIFLLAIVSYTFIGLITQGEDLASIIRLN